MLNKNIAILSCLLCFGLCGAGCNDDNSQKTNPGSEIPDPDPGTEDPDPGTEKPDPGPGPGGNEPGTGEETVKCTDGQHVFENSCEPDDMQNCGKHGVSCGWAQICQDGSCQNRPCNYSKVDAERSPALCIDNHMLVCGNNSTYYYDSKNGNCTEQNPCTVCPDGFAGCSNDADTFCKNHQALPDELPKTCTQNVYPPRCIDNTGYICGNKGTYYSSANTRCSGTDKCVLCQNGYIGCGSDPKAFCAEKYSAPVVDSSKCTVGHRRCDGKKLMECDGTSYSRLVENCPYYCRDGSSYGPSACSSDKPYCDIKNGSYVKIVGWNDGDTLVVTDSPLDDSCYPNNRVTVRVYHIDSPECSKRQNALYSNIKTCVIDTNYTSTNDPYGYQAWEASTSMADRDTVVRLFCDNADEYNVCPTDDNDRILAYVSVGNTDVSTELTRLGLAIPSLGRVMPQSEREKSICNALIEAVQNRRQLWSACSTSDGQCVRETAAKLLSTREGEFDYIYERCQYIVSLEGSVTTPEPVCTAGTDVCLNGNLYHCSDDGNLQFTQACPFDCADSTTCGDVSQVSCTPGTSKCVNNKMYYCADNGHLEFLQNCKTSCYAGQVCSDEVGIEYCVNREHYFWMDEYGVPVLKSESCVVDCNGKSCSCSEALDCRYREAPLCLEGRCQVPEFVSCTKGVSSGICGGDGNAYFCGNSGSYYFGRRCDDVNVCHICPGGFGGCTNSPETFCH